MLILFEACASCVVAASGIHAIGTILHTGQILAIPHIIICLLPSFSLVIPLLFCVACGIATCPMLVLQETVAICILANVRLHAILAIGSGTENVAIPYVLPRVDPSIIFPHHLIFACLVATCPMIILFVAVTLGIRALSRVHAIFSIFRSRELMTIPDRLIALRLPRVINPFHMRLTRSIATGPMFILSPAVAGGVATTQGRRAVLSILAATLSGCPHDAAFRNLQTSPRGRASDRQQTGGPDGQSDTPNTTGSAGF